MTKIILRLTSCVSGESKAQILQTVKSLEIATKDINVNQCGSEMRLVVNVVNNSAYMLFEALFLIIIFNK